MLVDEFQEFQQEFHLKKVPQKIREVHSLPQIPHTLEQEERRACASGSSSSITTNFRVSLGSRNRFFRCLWTKQRIFCGLAIIFSWTRGMSSPFSHWSRSVTRSGSSVTRGLFSAWSSSSLRHDGQPHKADDRRRRTSCESKTLQAQSNAIAAPIRKAFIFNQLMHAQLLSFCRYFAKIADARGAMSLSLVKCQVKKFLSAACPQGACVEAPFCVTMTVAIEFHSRALIRAHVRSRRHFAKLPLPNSRAHFVLEKNRNTGRTTGDRQKNLLNIRKGGMARARFSPKVELPGHKRNGREPQGPAQKLV